MTKIANFLNQHMTGNVFANPRILDAFAVDQSILRIRPQAVAQPISSDEVRKLARFSYQLANKGMQFGITSRGSGSDQTGASIGQGIVLSTAKLNRVKEIDPRQRLIRVEAGVKLGELNKALALHSLTIPIQAGEEHTIGGLIANGYSGPTSNKYGPFLNFVEQIEFVLSNGEVVHTESLGRRALRKKKEGRTLEADIYRKLDQIIAENPGLIDQIQSRKAGQAGYRGISQIYHDKKRFDLMPILFGSQGTLGIVTEAILRVEYITDPPLYVTAAFQDFHDAQLFVDRANTLDASQVDIYDIDIFNTADAFGKPLRILKKRPDTGYIVLVAFDDYRKSRRTRKVKKLRRELDKAFDWASASAIDYDHQAEISAILEAYLNSSTRRARLPFIDGASIPTEYFADYILGLEDLSTRYKTALTCYGSAATSIYNVRPEIDITTTNGRSVTLDVLRDYTELVATLGGTLTGAAPEGRFKSIYATLDETAPELAELNRTIKEIFDPRNVLNPGVKVDVNARATVRGLRVSPSCGIITP